MTNMKCRQTTWIQYQFLYIDLYVSSLRYFMNFSFLPIVIQEPRTWHHSDTTHFKWRENLKRQWTMRRQICTTLLSLYETIKSLGKQAIDNNLRTIEKRSPIQHRGGLLVTPSHYLLHFLKHSGRFTLYTNKKKMGSTTHYVVSPCTTARFSNLIPRL